MDYIRVTVKTTTEGSDVVSEILGEYSSGGVIIEDAADIKNFKGSKEQWDYIDEHLADSYDSEVCVRGFLGEDEDIDGIVEEIKQRLSELKKNAPDFPLGSLKVECEKIRDENWGETWKKFYKPFKPAEKIVIKPTWEDYEPQSGDLVLELDPGAAFGTGSHETTRMCIGFLEKYITPDCDVMDVGCGTGILAMCAALLGAKSVLAVDIDESAVKVAKENVEAGGFNIKVECGNLLEDRFGTVDVIVANIIADAVKALAPAAKENLRENGVYITSGIINERADEVENAIKDCGFTLLERKSMGEWTAFAWKK